MIIVSIGEWSERECILIVEHASCVFAYVLQYIYCEIDKLGNAVWWFREWVYVLR